MAEVSAKQVAELRRVTGAGMMDCKQALQEAGGDLERAKEVLRERGLAEAKKRAGRAAADGAIGSYLHVQSERPVMGVLVELAAETDFVAKNELFVETANDIAMHVAAYRPEWIRREEVPEAVVERERELSARQAESEGKPDSVVPRIVEGRMRTFFEEQVLYEQPFVNPDKFSGTVGEMVDQLSAKMGEKVEVRRFARLTVGEDESA